MGNVEIPKWLEGLPLAPEFRPTDTEFADPIAYISKIEKEASAFGICKVIPPLPKPSKKYVFGNLNKSLLKSPELGSSYLSSSSKAGSSDGGSDGEVRAVFTTRQQELGQTVKKSKGAVQNPSSGAHKQVWQSGEIYTLEQFESKSRVFAKSQLGMIKDVSPLVIEAMFWKAASEKPIYLEYANDVPGSGFGEPDGQFRYFHRRRRKRNFFTRTGESSSCKTSDMDSDRIDVSPTDDIQLASPRNESCIGVSVSPSSPPALPAAKEASQSLKKRSQRSCHDKEGTAGWKISNSPWNLQVISRSPGSLTRFMPDDIPGVTSPMVYIGMLFSWFAWHVEDHELHSMNFLHTGASKTWYSVPGDYAFAFEEVVRTEAYGANIDLIAALALLGEKTTLMSPKVAVASGIPCCRLVQNPGEFVVTFPRAYHIGFSHGFNCGEAANFGTPQWLNVAKEAAVRRAAMSYLPMLSHQQLLYLLTMSFVSRVPRCFLPGVRSSRLRDRQKEEREFLVKKAFVEDILHENKTLSVLLGKDSGYHAVLWNQDLLAHPGKETVSPSAGATVDAISTEKSSHVDTRKHSNKHPSLLDEMSMYMENLNDLYLGSDDLSCDFQVDSGTLACVACGILGFPFMSVVQPSEKAALDLDQEYPGTSGCPKPCSTQTLDASNDFSFPENPSSLSNSSVVNRPLPSINKSRNGWNVHNKFLRPRSFCLEHAVEIVELLQSKGGANVLVICHSDYKKIKAHATTIAEEIGCSFSYSEVPLDIASKEDLNLIDLAVEGVEHKETGEDWTSKLGINLRHCVKIRKNSASKQVQHALTLGGLLSNKCSSSDFSAMKWKMRRSRSKKIYLPDDIKPRNTAESKIDVLVEKNSLAVKKEAKIIQYTRRKLKTKQGDSSGAGKICGNPTTLVDHEQSKFASENKIRNAGNSTGIDFSPTTVQGMPTEMPKPKETRYESSKVSVGSVEIHSLEEINGDSEVHRVVASVESDQMQTEPNVAAQKVGSADEPGKEHSACLSQHLTERSIEIYEEKNVVEQSNRTNEACNLASEGRSKVLGDENVLASSPAYPGDEAMESSCMDNQVCALVPVVDNVVCGVPDTRTNDVKPDSCTTAGKDHYLGSMQEFFEGPREICSAVESSNENPLETEPEQNKSRVNEQNETVPVLTKVTSENLSDLRAGLTLDEELHKNVGVHAGKIEELASCSATQMEVDNPCVSMLEHPVVERGNSPQGHLTNDVILGDCSKVEASMEKGEQGSVPFHVSQAGNQPIAIEREELAEDHPQDGLTLDDNIERKRQDKEKETVSVTATAFQKYSRVRRDVRSAEDSCNGSEVCSPQDRESENVGTNAVEGGSNTGKGRKRNRELERLAENKLICSNFIRSPCEGLRPRAGKDATESSSGADVQREVKQKPETKIKNPPTARPPPKEHNKEEPGKLHKCDIEGCRMSFVTKAELSLHKRNLCPHKGCGKKFSSHKYAMVHHRVHDDERPLKCPWKGCSMSFKWAWARTEHIRVHTGEKPYKCKIEGCGLSFRFVSDFSRHRRKTGHFVS